MPRKHPKMHIVRQKFLVALGIYFLIALVVIGAIGSWMWISGVQPAILLITIWGISSLLGIFYTQVLEGVDLLASTEKYDDFLGGGHLSNAERKKANHKKYLKWFGVLWVMLAPVIVTVIKILEVSSG